MDQRQEGEQAVSIDGFIGWVQPQPNGDCELFLVEHPEPMASPRGQATLTIEQPTWQPEIGMVVLGGANTVEIVASEQERHHYRRIGYTRLREARHADH